jgi:hypothetical protein
MKPIPFNEATNVLQKPDNMTDEECTSLPVFRDGKVCISLWKASLFERIKFMITGKIWIWVLSGKTQPPIILSIKYPFEREKP